MVFILTASFAELNVFYGNSLQTLSSIEHAFVGVSSCIRFPKNEQTRNRKMNLNIIVLGKICYSFPELVFSA